MAAELISLVIPTFDRPAALDACLAGLAAQTRPAGRFEVVVVDDGGSFDLGEVVERHLSSLNLVVTRRPHAGPAAARNAGSALARGSLLAFTDDDCVPTPDWLETLVAALERSPGSVVGGRTVNTLTHNACSEASQWVIDYLYAEGLRRTGELPFVASNNLALTHDLFEELGGFDESFTRAGAEDRDLSTRCRVLGHSLVYEPAALVRHAHPLGVRGLLRQYVAYGRGARRLAVPTAGRAYDRVGVRSPDFYARMLLDPFRRLPLGRAAVVSTLVAVTQLASAYGYATESRSPRANAPPHVSWGERDHPG